MFGLFHLRSLFETEFSRRKKLQLEKDSVERQIALIKDVLLTSGNIIDKQTKDKLFLISNTTSRSQTESKTELTTIDGSVRSLISSSDIDQTVEDIDLNASCLQRRHSTSLADCFSKRKSEVKVKDFSEGFKKSFQEAENKRLGKKRGNNVCSNSNSNSPEMRTLTPLRRSDSDQVKTRAYDARICRTETLPPSTPVGRYSSGRKLSRTHDFVFKTIIRNEKCHPCGEMIKFRNSAAKCSDCRIISHLGCKAQCRLPCIPVIRISTKDALGTLADYTSSTPPMIPPLIVQCVHEIESRGLKEIGLYRSSGSEREVKDLKKKLLKKHNITLHQTKIHVLCGTIKDFLHSLKDAIITREMWQTFVDASEHGDETVRLNSMYDAVCDLPQPNKETLAFFILHLQRIAEAPHCRMPKENLALVLGPTLIGYSAVELSNSKILTETAQQHQVMRSLLSLPSVSLESLLSLENLQTRTPGM